MVKRCDFLEVVQTLKTKFNQEKPSYFHFFKKHPQVFHLAFGQFNFAFKTAGENQDVYQPLPEDVSLF